MHRPIPIYIYSDAGMASTAAPEVAILHCFGDLVELSLMFGGWVRYGRMDDGTRSYGVYGTRNAARLRRLLSDSGLELQYLHRSPPERMICRETNGPRPDRLQRSSLEKKLQRRWRAPQVDH